MAVFLASLKKRNFTLYVFGWCCLIAAAFSLLMIVSTNIEVLGINAWIKPLKFFLSSGIFSWSMAWYMIYLDERRKVRIFNWVVILVLSFETIYIALQAGKGQLSHFNISDGFHAAMFSAMGVAIAVMTVWTGYIGYLFFAKQFPLLPPAYVWGIRLGILLFVVFAFQGGLMAALLAHTVGAPDGGSGLPLVNWSTKHGDLRVAHFFGMHALQLLPLFGFYIAKNIKAIVLFSLAYFIIISLLFVQALTAKPFLGL